MKISITYTELSDIIRAKTGKDVTIEYVDSKSINVKTTIKDSRVHVALLRKIVDKLLDLVEIEVKVRLCVNSVSSEQLSVQYEADKYADKLITIIGNNVPELNDYVTFCGDNKVVILLNRIKQMEEITKKVTILDTNFNENEAEVSFSLK